MEWSEGSRVQWHFSDLPLAVQSWWISRCPLTTEIVLDSRTILTEMIPLRLFLHPRSAARSIQSGNLDTAPVEIDPLNGLQSGVGEKGFKMAAEGRKVGRQRSDREGMVRAVHLHGVGPEQTILRPDLQPPETVVRAAEAMNERLVVQLRRKMCAPILDEVTQMTDKSIAARRLRSPAVQEEHGLMAAGFRNGVSQEQPFHLWAAEIKQLHPLNVLKHGIIQCLGLVFVHKRSHDLDLVEHLTDDEIEAPGLVEVCVGNRHHHLGMNLESLGAQASGEVVLVDTFIKQAAEPVLRGIGASHHCPVNQGKLRVVGIFEFKSAVDGHR